ncbi:unnamed protein product [Acanthoscelides obtectus]|uniref:Uncharacterized protein n=1 Tax=Acanthoscelides obtectus TaxID=200917 RepID=A0A9P0P440_ACAOB|nr:unnamed protein product [Acanthoscelides obtectus]CAK1622904.1 hypothetical protein AOBTE_LOCUS1721 [Acanthoscelides obtectus]
MAACALYNFLMDTQPTVYAPANCLYQESDQNGNILSVGCDSTQSNMNPLQSCNRGNICENAKEVREHFMDYFMDEGKVPRQNNHILRNNQN